jgi:hypothetical protein
MEEGRDAIGIVVWDEAILNQELNPLEDDEGGVIE